jgi:hypothetical protein
VGKCRVNDVSIVEETDEANRIKCMTVRLDFHLRTWYLTTHMSVLDIVYTRLPRLPRLVYCLHCACMLHRMLSS